MRKLHLLYFFVLFSTSASAQTIIASKDGISYCGTTACLGQVDPCTQLLFEVSSTIPSGFNSVYTYEWYENQNSNPSKTANGSDDHFQPTVNSLNYQVKCVVKYINTSNGSISSGYTSNIFLVTVKAAGLNNIQQSSEAILGCTNSITFSSSASSGFGIWTPSSYSITWQNPSGWTVIPPGAQLSEIVAPNATTGGVVTAKMILSGCPFTASKTLQVNRTTPSPTFSTSNQYGVCAGTYAFAINSICGAVNYTYTISGNSDCKFTANNSQLLTTSSTSVNIIFPSGNFSVTLDCKANYIGGLSSSNASKTISSGYPAPPTITVNGISPYPNTQMDVTVNTNTNPPYLWYVNGILVKTAYSKQSTINIGTTCGSFPVTVKVSNSCGSVTAGDIYYRSCTGKYKISPNPGSANVVIEGVGNSTFQLIKIIDRLGNVRKKISFEKGSKKAQFNVNELPRDIYNIMVYDGKNWMSISFSKM